MKPYLIQYFIVTGVLAFLAYGIDKHLAKRNRQRIPEKLLLSLGFFGGAVGALAAMNVFRHKTRHWYFWVINFAGLVWVVTVIYFLDF